MSAQLAEESGGLSASVESLDPPAHVAAVRAKMLSGMNVRQLADGRTGGGATNSFQEHFG